MQDRIASKLGKPLQELFSDTRVPEALLHKALWGVGLRDALKREGAPDAKGLADVLEQPYTLVQKWVTLEERVPPAMQAQVAERLGVQPSELFSDKTDQGLWWGVGLRTALRETETQAMAMAQDIGVGVEEVRRWMDLLSPVSGEQRREISKYLNRKPNLVFIPSKPSTRRYAVGLRAAMRNSTEFGTPGALADALDTEQSIVNDWLDLGQPIYQGATAAVAELLGTEESDLFSAESPKPEDFRLARPELREAVDDRFNGDLDGFARAVVTDSEHAHAWLRGRIGLADPTRDVIVSVLNDRNPTGARLLPSALFRSKEPEEQEDVPPSGATHSTGTG
jgi:hypothetical protein